MSSQVKFVQNQNNFLHGVRGVIFIDGDVAGAVQDISATESGEEDVVYVMGSRYPQAKEIKNKIVNGTIKSLIFDPTVQKLMKLTDPAVQAVLDNEALFDEDSNEANVLPYTDTQLKFGRTADSSIGSLIPMFDMKILSRVMGTKDQTVNINQDVQGTKEFKGFAIMGAVIKSYEVMFNKDTFWLANIEFVADKLIRIGDNNDTAI